MSDHDKPVEAPPSNQEIIDAINALTAQETALRNAVAERNNAVQEVLTEQQTLETRREQAQANLHQAQYEVEVNAAHLSNRREALSRLFAANPPPQGFRDLLQPLRMITDPAPVPEVSTPAAASLRNTGSVSKKHRVTGDQEENSEYEEEKQPGSKRKRAPRVSRAAAEANGLALEHNQPGLLDWVFKSNAPAYLKGAESVIWVRSPFTLLDDDVNKHVGKYYSLLCPICKGNSSVGKNGEFMCGLDGMWLHVTRQHKESEWAKKKAMNVFDSIPKTELTADEVLRIRQKKKFITSTPAWSGSRPVDEYGRRIKKEPVKKRSRKPATGDDAAGTAEQPQADNTSAVDNLLGEVGATTPRAREETPFREASPIPMRDPETEREMRAFERANLPHHQRGDNDDDLPPIATSPSLPRFGSFPPVNRRAAAPQLSPSPAVGRARHVPTSSRRSSRVSVPVRRGPSGEETDEDEDEDDDSVDEVPA